jgi:CheY-like chemotaxis protein
MRLSMNENPAAEDFDDEWWTDGRFSGKNVLVVDDIKMNQELLRFSLEDAEIEVLVADDGLQAIELLKSTSVDLVLMDIQMPVMDGLTATREIRNDLSLVRLPIIAMTAHAKESDKQASKEAGMNDHLVKPIDPDDLFDILKIWL